MRVIESFTVWVCCNCLHHAANGECGDCHNPDGHEGGAPLSLLSVEACPGMGWEDHNEGCHVFTSQGEDRDECACEERGFSTSSCEGCGSDFHGDRYAMTDWLK